MGNVQAGGVPFVLLGVGEQVVNVPKLSSLELRPFVMWKDTTTSFIGLSSFQFWLMKEKAQCDVISF